MNTFLLKFFLKLKYSKTLKRVQAKINAEEKKFHAKSYTNNDKPLVLSEITLSGAEEVKSKAVEIYGNNWNYYSDALRTEVLKNFEDCIEALKKQNLNHVNYLEIGSAQGISMSLNSLLISNFFKSFSTTSIDPYFEDGYKEGAECVTKKEDHIHINQDTKFSAFKLYKSLKLNVEHIESISFDGLIKLLNEKRKFNYIYIDGFHENFVPMQDLALCIELLEPNGIVLLDDHQSWEDVGFLKFICEKNMIKISESWKIVAYMKRS